jgi:four helix bundle protein
MSGTVKDYRDLIVWRKSIDLVKRVYALTHRFPQFETYALADQLRRAVVSIPSNIAEGQSRRTGGDFRQFIHVALGSAGEVDTQVVIAHELGYITLAEANDTAFCIAEVRRMLRGLLASL